jgi:hypothetical protein
MGTTIAFQETELKYTGRNGTGKASGIYVGSIPGYPEVCPHQIYLNPITSRKERTNSAQIPVEIAKVPEVCKALLNETGLSLILVKFSKRAEDHTKLCVGSEAAEKEIETWLNEAGVSLDYPDQVKDLLASFSTYQEFPGDMMSLEIEYGVSLH